MDTTATLFLSQIYCIQFCKFLNTELKICPGGPGSSRLHLPSVLLLHGLAKGMPAQEEKTKMLFCFRFFSWIIFPQAHENNSWVISNFFENSRRYSQVKVCHRYQWHQQQILTRVLLVLLIPVANLPAVSTTPVANNGNNRYQTADNLKWTWRKNIIYSICSLYYPKSKRNNENFSDWRVFHLPPMSLTPVRLELRISPRIFEKIPKRL